MRTQRPAEGVARLATQKIQCNWKLGDESRRPETAIRGGGVNGEGGIGYWAVYERWKNWNPMVEKPHEITHGMAPVVAWNLDRISFACIGLCKRLVTTGSHALLLVEPHISHSFRVERPAANVDHERDHEQVDDPACQGIHVLFSRGILSGRAAREAARLPSGRCAGFSGPRKQAPGN